MTRRRALPDVNVLVALAWPNHLHHAAAVRWFRAERSRGWATCPLTESGFVRVSANPRVGGGRIGVPDAIDLLASLRQLGNHEFWPDDVSIVASPEVPRERLAGYRQVTDAHLVALARARGGVVVTFDAGVAALAPDGPVRVLTASRAGSRRG